MAGVWDGPAGLAKRGFRPRLFRSETSLPENAFAQNFRKRTTFDLPDPLFREVKMRAVQQGLKLKDLVASYIEAGLRCQPAVPSAAARHHYPLPIARALKFGP